MTRAFPFPMRSAGCGRLNRERNRCPGAADRCGSYFVRLQTPDCTRVIWSKDIERPVAKSLTQPQIGDEVVLQRTGREAVTVKRREEDAQELSSPSLSRLTAIAG